MSGITPTFVNKLQTDFYDISYTLDGKYLLDKKYSWFLLEADHFQKIVLLSLQLVKQNTLSQQQPTLPLTKLQLYNEASCYQTHLKTL